MPRSRRQPRQPLSRRRGALVVSHRFAGPVLALALLALRPAGPADALDRHRIVAVGDSITEGVVVDPPGLAERPYPAGLQLLLDAQRAGFTVVNHGRGGETTDQGLARLPGVLAAEQPGFVLLMEGTNDATFRVDPSAIVANLRDMIHLAKASGAVPVLGAIPPNFRPFAPEAQAIIASVNAQLPGLAVAEGIRFVDTFSALSDPGLYGSDALHPNQQGYDVLAAAWLPAVLAAIDAAAPPAAVVGRVSVAGDGSQAVYPPPDGGAYRPVISGDRRVVAFRANASNLLPGDTNARLDVFLHDRQTGALARVSVASDGTQASGDSGADIALSADGALVGFASRATNLAPGDTNGTSDVFVHDRQTGTTERVSLGPGSVQGTGGTAGSAEVSLSADGRQVAFTADYPNFTSGAPGKTDVFVRDRLAATTTRVSVAQGGGDTDGDSGKPSISADGQVVVFASRATNLVVPATTAGRWHVYARRLDIGVTTLVSVAPGGGEGNGPSGFVDPANSADRPVVSGDGRLVAFTSGATNLVPGDTNGIRDVFVRDLVAGVTTRVSVTSEGAQAAGAPDVEGSWVSALSADGRFVAFTSWASNLAVPDQNGVRDVFVHDRATGLTARVDVARDGSEADAASRSPSLSADGRAVAFESLATNLVAGDTNGDALLLGRDAYVALLRSFADVRVEHFGWPWIESLVAAGVTTGCRTSPPEYCPDDSISREQMAVFLLRAHDGPAVVPPACATAPFADVPCSSPFASWIQDLTARGITAGCGGGNYCPAAPVTREAMAVFLLRTVEGAAFTPPPCATATFTDVPCSSAYAPWIYELVARGVTAGCGAAAYCPARAVTRAEMAVFLVKAFDLPR